MFVTIVAALLTGLGVLCMATGRDDEVISDGILLLLIGTVMLTWQIWPEPAVVHAETHDRGAPAPLRRSP